MIDYGIFRKQQNIILQNPWELQLDSVESTRYRTAKLRRRVSYRIFLKKKSNNLINWQKHLRQANIFFVINIIFSYKIHL